VCLVELTGWWLSLWLQGKGSYVNGKRLSTSTTTDLSKAVVVRRRVRIPFCTHMVVGNTTCIIVVCNIIMEGHMS
jgi:hypothetical protein